MMIEDDTQLCTCAAWEPNECCCGAWDDVDPEWWYDDEAREDVLGANKFCFVDKK